jgi:hypothetical protein
MKKLTQIMALAACIALIGCAKTEEAPASSGANTTVDTKAGQMKGVGADQVGVTNAGAGADAATGSKAGG